MEIRVLGSLEVIDDAGNQVEVRGARLTNLLTALALRCGTVVGDDRLMEVIWGDELPSRPANALQRQVSTLRRSMGAAAVQRRGGGYALVLDPDDVDVFRFERFVHEGRQAAVAGDHGAAAAAFSAALRLWRGEALADVAGALFAHGERARLAEIRLEAVEARIDAELALGNHGAMVAELEQLVAEHPLRERLRALQMLALARSGRQSDALDVYRSARAVLGDELGIEPSPALRELEVAILRQDEGTVHRHGRAAIGRTARWRTPLTSLVGREDELVALRSVVDRSRLVTLVGPGGVGKTRVAVEIGRRMLSAGSADVWLVELAELSEPEGLASTIAQALDIAVSVDATVDLPRVIERLCGRSALVILDNCEHVLDAAARVTRDLLELCPTLRIVATSREHLGVPGEVVWPVPPLSLDDAVNLFVERGQTVAPLSDITGAGPARAAVASICTRLDGLPLAIELAASRLRAMPLGELAIGLDDRFRLLNRGPRTAEPRQQTLRAVVDWSYDLLFDDERRVLDRLSVFTGGCAVTAACAVCADAEITADEVAEVLTHLADKSLITLEVEPGTDRVRVRMLQTLVEYGRERLRATGEAPRIRAAHARYFGDLAVASVGALRGERQRHWLGEISANLGNLRSVLDGAVAAGDAETAYRAAAGLGWFWWFTGRASEGAGWLALARGSRGPVAPLTRARLLAWTAFTAAPGFVSWSEPDEQAPAVAADVDGLCAEAIATYRQSGALAELAALQTALAVSYSTRGRYGRAGELLAESASLFDSLGEPAMSTFAAARRAFAEDRSAEAEAAFRSCLPLLAELQADVHRSFAYRYLGRLAGRRGDHLAATVAIEEALLLARSLGLAGFTGVLLTDLGAARAAAGDFDGARLALEQPLAAARDQRAPGGIAAGLAALAWVEFAAGDLAAAARLAAEALASGEGPDGQETAAHCHALIGAAMLSGGEPARARAEQSLALAAGERANDPRPAALALEGLAGTLFAEGDAPATARLLGAAGTLRSAPGGAHGWAFAPWTTLDVSRLSAEAVAAAGADACSVESARGAADPRAVIDAVLNPRP